MKPSEKNLSGRLRPDDGWVVIPYLAAPGASLRNALNLGPQNKLWVCGGSIMLFAWLGTVAFGEKGPFHTGELRLIAISFYVFLGWLLCCFSMLLLAQDGLYLDRLWCVIPGKNPLVGTKILWSKLEELAIVDRSRDGSGKDFAIKLIETSGAEHFIELKLLSKEDLPAFIKALKDRAPHARGLAQLTELDRFYDYQRGKLPQMSYTQLWESSCTAQFGLTSFTPLVPGSRIQNSYTVVKQIAAGGFSAIYLINSDEHEQFILKESVLPPGLDEACKRSATEHFEREAQILSKLNHSQIAQVFDHFVENGRNYLRIEYIKGQNLRDYLAEHGPQSEILAEQWTMQLAKIAQYLHELTPPVVHRDLTPDNVVLREDGTVVLIDFGAANEFVGSATGTLIGKHAYMAPEQIRGCAEPASDLYAFGSCAYFFVTGKDPEPIRTSSPIRSGVTVSERFDTFIRKCTSLETGDRFASAAECLHYLKDPVAAE